MSLSNLKPARGSKHRKKIVGRGVGSGHGRSSTRGCKGQKARSGDGSKKIGFEGGQMPIFRRIPKRGFKNRFRKEYEIVNVGKLDKFDAGTEITPVFLKKVGFVSKTKFVKILGDDELTKSLRVYADAFSRSAFSKIETVGGKAEIVKWTENKKSENINVKKLY
ncbi:MAG: 50S ribosomal protein L15 [Endomicrobium sp.]|nr:50S ribosomal protein L15 [Endomicrobium sp.]